LFNGHARIYDWLDKAAVQELVGQHLEGKQNRRLLVWSLLLWKIQFYPVF
jgi:asparagine synthase (glutamine-hydrolysing)